MKAALVQRFGGSIEVDGTPYSAFPDASRLADAGEASLADVIRNPRKAAYIADAALKIMALDEAFLRHGPYDDVRSALLNIKGIGAWSAHFVMARGLGRVERCSDEERLVAAASDCYRRPLNR